MPIFYWVPCLSVILYIYFLLFSSGVSNIYHKYILPQIYIQIFFTFLMVCFQRLMMLILVLFSLDYQSFPWWLLFCFLCVRNFCLMMWGSFSKLPFTFSSKIYLRLVFEYGENYSFSVGLLFSSLNKFWFFFPEFFFSKFKFERHFCLVWNFVLVILHLALWRCHCIISVFHYFCWEGICKACRCYFDVNRSLYTR